MYIRYSVESIMQQVDILFVNECYAVILLYLQWALIKHLRLTFVYIKLSVIAVIKR